MPQDELFSQRRAHELRLSLISDPLQPSKPWKAKLLVLDRRGEVLESASTTVPPVWEAEAWADIARAVVLAYANDTALRASWQFHRVAKEWRVAANQLLTTGE